MDVTERIQAIITTEGLTVATFARKIGIHDQTIRGIVVQRRNKPGFNVLSKIVLAFPTINSEWLLTGKGEMNIPQKAINKKISIEELVLYIKEKDEQIELLVKENLKLSKEKQEKNNQ